MSELAIKKKNTVRNFVVFGIIIVILQSIFTFTDLKISYFFYDKDGFFGKFILFTGVIPLYLAITFCGILLYGTKDKNNKKQYKVSTILGIFFTFMGFDFCFNGTLYFIGFTIPLTIMAYVISIVLTVVCIKIINSIDTKKMIEFRKIAITGIYYIVFSFFSVQIFKVIWGRVRFYDLDESASQFTYWFLPQGFTGNFSFPSAHVGGAASMLILTLLSYHPAFKNKKTFFYILSFIVIAIVGLGRIVYGAHYASDVIGAIVLSVISLEVSKKITKLE